MFANGSIVKNLQSAPGDPVWPAKYLPSTCPPGEPSSHPKSYGISQVVQIICQVLHARHRCLEYLLFDAWNVNSCWESPGAFMLAMGHLFLAEQINPFFCSLEVWGFSRCGPPETGICPSISCQLHCVRLGWFTSLFRVWATGSSGSWFSGMRFRNPVWNWTEGYIKWSWAGAKAVQRQLN